MSDSIPWICPKCAGSGLRRGIEPAWFTHPALLHYFGKPFAEATRGRSLPGIDENRRNATGSIVSEPLPPDVARQAFDALTNGNRSGTSESKITDRKNSQLFAFTHAHEGTIWQIYLLNGTVGGSLPFSQLQLVFSEEWEPTAHAVVKSYLSLFVTIGSEHEGIKGIRRVGYKDNEITQGTKTSKSSKEFESPVLHDDEAIEDTIDDLAPEGLGVGEVTFEDADSEYR